MPTPLHNYAPFIKDINNNFCNLIDCDIYDTTVNCSIVWFLGGINGTLTVTDGVTEFEIKIPEFVEQSTTHVLKINSIEKICLKRTTTTNL